ncbi:MAG TPA: VOC family protein [Gemmataceae bacterium]|jgi:PhnB protein|nr:VOC family protein [Gemmataceae bacterium]
MQIQPHLSFEGRCEEAVEFYKKALGAEVMFLARFKDIPGPQPPGSVPPGGENKIMHTSFRVGDSTILASDGHCSGKGSFQGIQLAIQVQDVAAAERVFHALTEGGQVKMPLMQTFWSPRFGMVTDKFGLDWMINVDGGPPRTK